RHQFEIPLREELELVDAYLDIVRLRFGDRVVITRTIDADALDAFVPVMVLQPLVENAIRHGIEPQPGGGHVEIQATSTGESIVLTVRDNGRGLRQHRLAPRLGTGLRNTRRRLRQLYGRSHELTLRERSEGGVIVS